MIIISILNNNHKNNNRHTMEINVELTKRIRIDYDVYRTNGIEKIKKYSSSGNR